MAYTNGNGSRSSADLEREVNEQRNRIEARIGEIRDRLSPGQLLDEALSYTKHGGAQFASNLGQQVSANPLPAALVGIGLAWLMASNMNGGGQQPMPSRRSPQPPEDAYHPYAVVPGGAVTRTSHKADEAGEWWSEFQTETGSKFKARSDSLGNRAGHFVDESGKTFAGFIDSAGNRVRQFRDEGGNMLDDAMGWANHSWHDAQQGVGRAMHGVASGAERLVSGTRQLSGNLGGTMQSQADQMSRQLVSLYEQQPLIAGALAFAAGAALGAILPHTAQEDELIGEQADEVRRRASETAGQLYRQGKEQASEVYEEATDKASRLYGETKDRVAEVAGSNGGQTSMH